MFGVGFDWRQHRDISKGRSAGLSVEGYLDDKKGAMGGGRIAYSF